MVCMSNKSSLVQIAMLEYLLEQDEFIKNFNRSAIEVTYVTVLSRSITECVCDIMY